MMRVKAKRYVCFLSVIFVYAWQCWAACNSPYGISGDLSPLRGALFVCPGETYTFSVDFIWALGTDSDVATTTVTVPGDAENGDTVDVSLSYGSCTLNTQVTVSDGTTDTTEAGMAAAHPLEALEVIGLDAEAEGWARDNEALLGGGLAGGCADAARHAYFSARATQEFGEEDAEGWGNGHETSNFISCEDNNMDLTNNQHGRDIGSDNMDATPEEIADEVIDALRNGDLFVPGGADCTPAGP